ncbi:MAG: hypothetical protein GY863_16035 [bacterium]|nr:hypothetical protein [bacterium]
MLEKMQGSNFKIDNVIDISEEKTDKIEIPCKDLDLDCLPDEEGIVPFGNYKKCYLYDPDQGMCPLLPV